MPQAELPQTAETGPPGTFDAVAAEPVDWRPISDEQDKGSPHDETVTVDVVSRPTTLHHWLLLIGAVVVIALSAALQVRPEGRVGVPGLEAPLPGVCTFQRATGQPCPGCGLTRSFISIAHGDLVAAWYFNPSGILLFVLLAAQIPYRAIQVWRIRTGRGELHWTRLGFYLTWTVVVALVGQWLVRLILNLAA